MIDKILLGILIKQSSTTYDIKIAMERSISMFYSNSFGSINPAIKKLEKNNLVTCNEQVENGRVKKTYQITQDGKDEYNLWLQQPIEQGRLKDEVLIRVFFLGDSNKKQQQKLLEDYLNVLYDSKKELEATKKEVENKKWTAEQKKKIKYQLSTLKFGIDYIHFKIDWFKNLLNDL